MTRRRKEKKHSNMDDKLKNIVSRVEKSNLSRLDKDELYRVISRGLRRAALEMLVAHVNREKLNQLADNLVENLTEEAYFDLMRETVSNSPAVPKAMALVDEVMDGVGKVLTDEGL